MNSIPKKLLVIIPSLHIGGSEKVVIHLIRNLDRKKFQITLLVLNKQGGLIDSIPKDIETIYFGYSRTALSIFSIFFLIWLRKPQLVFTTLGHLNLLVALMKPFFPRSVRFCSRESSIVSVRNKDERYPRLFDLLFKTVYSRFDIVICQSQYMRKDLIAYFGIVPSKITVINNPVDFQIIPKRSAQENTEFINLLSVGNLRPEKGYERVLSALQKCNAPFKYRIVGGGDTSKLRSLIQELSLNEKVTLIGQQQNPLPFYLNADCLVLGSYYEGFPNVVLEANACGLPVVAYKAPGGHNEIIVEGINGWFVESGEELCKLIDSQVFKFTDREKIISLTKERYDMTKIIGQYEQTFTEVLT